MCAPTLLTTSVQSIADMDTYAQFGRAALDALRVVPDDAPDGRRRSLRIGIMGRTVLEIGVDTDSEELEPEDPQPAEEPQHTDEIPMLDFVANFMQQEIPMLDFVANFMQQAQFSSNITVTLSKRGMGPDGEAEQLFAEMTVSRDTKVGDVLNHMLELWPRRARPLPTAMRMWIPTVKFDGYHLKPHHTMECYGIKDGDTLSYGIARNPEFSVAAGINHTIEIAALGLHHAEP